MKNPWVGLRPFSVDEAGLFFGRDHEVQILSNLVATLPTLILYAPSGTGKSSLINAGLMPMLSADPGQLTVLIREPQDDVEERARAVLAASGWVPPVELDLVAMLEQHWLDTDRRTVVIIDQFEERLNFGTPTEELYAAISKLAHSQGDSACVMLSLREDYLGSLEPLMRWVPGLLSGSYRVAPLTRRALEEAVYGPLENVGADAALQPDLVQRVLDDLDECLSGLQDPGEQRFEPGYFQIVWSTLWRELDEGRAAALDIATYERLGGAKRMLKDFTSTILGALDPAQTSIFWSIARYLVLPTGAKVALTVDDLVNLLQPSDFLYPFEGSAPFGSLQRTTARRSWLQSLPATELANLIRSVLQRLTASDAPIFKRAVRLNREEFEIVHDLLGRIILDWREAHRSAQQAADEEFNALLVASANSKYGWGSRRLVPRDARRHSARVERQIVEAARTVREQLEQQVTPGNIDTLVASLQSLLVLRSLVDSYSFRKQIGYSRTAELVTDWDRLMANPIQAIVGVALNHPSEIVRRPLQDLLAYVEVEGDRFRVKVTEPTPILSVVGTVLTAGFLGFGSVAIAFAILYRPIYDLAIQYPFLMLAHLVLAVAVMYEVLLEGEGGGWGSRIANAAVPFIDEKKPAQLAVTWPLPSVYVVASAVGVAWVFQSLGWAATAGFAVGMVYTAIAFIAAWAWAVAI